jgi:vancomycin resistance protein YoaR
MILTAAIISLFSLLIVADYLYFGQRVYHGVYLGDMAVGGLTPEEAGRLLDLKLAEEGFAAMPLFFSLGDNKWNITCEELGVEVDYQSCFDAYHTGGRENHLLSYPARLTLLFKPVTVPLVFSVNREVFYAAVEQIRQDVSTPAKDAELNLTEDRKKAVIIGDIPGRELDIEGTLERLNSALSYYPSLPTIEIALEETAAAQTAAHLESLFIREEIATYTTVFSNAIPNRVHNIRLSAAALDGVLVEPDGVFSFNDNVGNVGAAQGYKPAPVIVNRQLVEGIGGGICQVSSTLYNAILLADLSIVERTNHGLTVGYLPPGLDATVSYGWLDFKFLNNRNHAVWIRTFLSGNNITISIYGDPIPGHEVKILVTDREMIAQGAVYTETDELPAGAVEKIKDGQPGWRVTVWRITYLYGEEIRREKLSRDVYSPVPAQYRTGKPEQNIPAAGDDRKEKGEEAEN